MDQQLPKYRGQTPDEVWITFTGREDELRAIFDPDEQVTMLVRGVAKTAKFSTNQFGVLRLQQQIKVGAALIPDSDQVAKMEAEIKRRADEASGQTSLDDDIDATVEGADDDG